MTMMCCAALLGSGCDQKKAAATFAAPATQVVAVEARRQTVLENLSLVGSLLPDETVDIKSEIEGVVLEINFEEGKPSEKGRLLVRLDDSKLAAAVAESEANFRLSESTYQRSKQLFEKTLVSQQEYDQSAAVYEVNKATLALKTRLLRDTRIYAPFAGIVASRRISPGQVIGKDTIITTLVGLDPVKVEINVPERFLGRLNVGQTIEMTVAAYPGKKFKGEVYFVTPSIDSLTRTALVKAKIPNPQHELKPGMFANLDLTLQTRDDALVVPEPALIPSGDRVSLYVVNNQMEAELRAVKVGVRMAGVVEIISGLKPGEKVIVEGIQKVRPGGTVKFAGAESGAPYAARPTATNPAASPH